MSASLVGSEMCIRDRSISMKSVPLASLAASAASLWSSYSSGRGSSVRQKTPLPRSSFRRRGVGRHRPSRACWDAIPRRIAVHRAGG
eukprot:861199-Alexandrium_andersonii.AAC.1